MSRPENRREFTIIEGPTALKMTDVGLFLTHSGTAIAFTNVEDFQEFVNRLGILTVRLDQMLNPLPGDDNPPKGDAGIGT